MEEIKNAVKFFRTREENFSSNAMVLNFRVLVEFAESFLPFEGKGILPEKKEHEKLCDINVHNDYDYHCSCGSLQWNAAIDEAAMLRVANGVSEGEIYEITEKWKDKACDIWTEGKSMTDLQVCFDEIAKAIHTLITQKLEGK